MTRLALERNVDGRHLTVTTDGHDVELRLTIAGVDVPPPLPLTAADFRWLWTLAGPVILAHLPPPRSIHAARPASPSTNGAQAARRAHSRP